MRRFAFLALALSLCACSGEKPPAAKGKALFAGMGCVQCHAIGGQGGTYGPDLTFVGFRKSPEWLAQWLENPHAWRPDTVMPKFNLTPESRQALVEFLSAQKGQGFDHAGRPWNAPELASNPAKRGEVLFDKTGCVACHAQGGRGNYPNNNVVGGLIPALAKVAEGYTKEELFQKIKNGVVSEPLDPSQPPPMIRMPPWGQVLKEDEIRAVVAYLFTLNKGAAGPSSKKEDAW